MPDEGGIYSSHERASQPRLDPHRIGRSFLARYGIPLLLGFGCLLMFVPWQPSWGGPRDVNDLRVDWSYILALPQLYLTSAQYGPDIVFTYGPLGWLAYGWVPSVLFYQMLFLRIALALTFAIAVHRLLDRSSLPYRWWWLVPGFVLGSMFFGGFADYFWISFSLLATIFYVQDGRPTTLTAALAGCAGLVGLVKFSFLLAGLACFGCVAVWDVYRRRVPLLSVVFAGSVVTWWALAGQRAVNLAVWIWQCIDLSSAYGEAMAKGFTHPYKAVDVLLLLAGALLPALAAVWTRRHLSGTGLVAVCLSAILFMEHKHAWGGNQIENAAITLLFLTFLCACIVPRWTVIMGCCFAIGIAGSSAILKRYNALPLYQFLKPAYTAGQVVQMARTLTIRMNPHRNRYERTLAWIRTVVPLQGMTGTADAIPNQGGIIAAYRDTLRYTPRPAYLGLNAHTPELARANAAFLRSPRAPNWLLFEVEPEGQRVNNRYPASVDGPSWLEAVAGYGLRFVEGNNAVLARQQRKTYSLIPLRQHRLTMGEAVSLTGDAPIWADIKVERSLIGHVTEFLYKTPHVLMEIKTTAGHVMEFQLLPGVASVGFVLSPFINSTADFLALANGQLSVLDKVTAVRFRVDGPAIMYAPTVLFRYARIEFSQPPPHSLPAIPKREGIAMAVSIPPPGIRTNRQ